MLELSNTLLEKPLPSARDDQGELVRLGGQQRPGQGHVIGGPNGCLQSRKAHVHLPADVRSVHAGGPEFERLRTLKAVRKGDPDGAQISALKRENGIEGLAFPVVAIPRLSFLPDRRNDESEEVRLAYVAMTRAMDRLIMTYHRDSSFVQRILDTGAPLAA